MSEASIQTTEQHQETVIAYEYIRNKGLCERTWTFYESDENGTPIYKSPPIQEHQVTSNYMYLGELYLTKLKALEYALGKQEMSVSQVQAALEREKTELESIKKQLEDV